MREGRLNSQLDTAVPFCCSITQEASEFARFQVCPFLANSDIGRCANSGCLYAHSLQEVLQNFDMELQELQEFSSSKECPVSKKIEELDSGDQDTDCCYSDSDSESDRSPTEWSRMTTPESQCEPPITPQKASRHDAPQTLSSELSWTAAPFHVIVQGTFLVIKSTAPGSRRRASSSQL